MAAESTLHHQPLASFDWKNVAADVTENGAAVLRNLLPQASCESVAALYDQPDGFRSHVHMARHNFGKGEYRYFAYPLPSWLASLRNDLYARLAPVANQWATDLRYEHDYPDVASRVHRALSRRQAEAPDAAAVALRCGRLQLPASGSIWRGVVSAAGDRAAECAGAGFPGRRAIDRRAATARAVEGQRDLAAAGRCCGHRRESPPTSRRPRLFPRDATTWSEPADARPAPHAGHHLSRRGVTISARPPCRASSRRPAVR